MICNKCGKPAVYIRPYSGEPLCASCFIKNINDRVRRTINKFSMFKLDDKIAIGVSGGKDSVVLLHILAEIEKRYPNTELVAVNINELAGEYSNQIQRIIKENTEELGIKLITYTFEEIYGITLDDLVLRIKKSNSKLTPCAYCGVMKRSALNWIAKKINATVIATGHNLNDQAQTIIMNFLRGDAHHLARIGPKLTYKHKNFVPRVKPLYEIPEYEIELYAKYKGIKYQKEKCPYSTEAMRNDIRSFIDSMESKRPGTMFAILRTFLQIHPHIQNIGKKRPLNDCEICGAPTSGKICKTCQLLKSIGITSKIKY